MAKRNVPITPGSGENVRFDGGNQIVKMAYGAEGVETLQEDKFATEAAQTTSNTKLDTIVAALTSLLAELQAKADLSETQPVSAATLPLPAGASTSAAQTTGNASLASLDGKLPALSGGKVLVTDPTALPLPAGAATQATLATLLTDAQLRASAVPVSIADANVTGQGSQLALNNNIVLAVAGATSYDADRFKTITLQIVPAAGTVTAGAVTFEGSNNNTDFQAVPMYDINSLTANPVTSYTLAASTNRSWRGPNMFRYFRARISTGVTGTTTGIQCHSRFSQEAFTHPQQTVTQATAANLNATVVSSGTATVSGPAAHGAAISGNPVRGGTRAMSANVTPVATGQTADAVSTLVGVPIQKPYSLPEAEFVIPDSITNSATAVQIKNATASNKNYVTSLTLAHAALAAAGEIQLRSTPVASTTATIASNTLVMAATYNWKVGDLVYCTASTVTGLVAGNYYYLLTVSGANLTFAATRGGATMAISGTTVSATLSKVAFRTQLQTAALPLTDIPFPNPADGGTNLAIEVCTPVAIATGRIDFNLCGYVAP